MNPNIIPSPSRELPPGYTVVEVGVGSSPNLFPPAPTIIENIHREQNTAWSFTEGRSYTGIDGGRGENDPLSARFYLANYEDGVQKRRPGENIRFLFGNVADPEIDAAANSADELLMCNVLSSDLDDYAKDSLLRHAGCLLTQGGLLVVRETFTPHLHPHYALLPRLERLRFEQPTIVDTNHPDFEALTQYYGPTIYDMGLSRVAKQPSPARYFGFALAP
jgi:hypothetical protein